MSTILCVENAVNFPIYKNVRNEGIAPVQISGMVHGTVWSGASDNVCQSEIRGYSCYVPVPATACYYLLLLNSPVDVIL